MWYKEEKQPENVNICFYQCHVLYFRWRIKPFKDYVFWFFGSIRRNTDNILFLSIAIFYVRTQILLLSHDKMHQPQNIWSCYNSIHAFWLPPQYTTILRLPCFVLANNRHKLPLCNDAYFWKILYTIKVWLWYSWLEEKKNQLISWWYASYITVIDLKWDVMLISDWLLFYWNERSDSVIENKKYFHEKWK